MTPVESFARHLAARPSANTREAYLRDVELLVSLIGPADPRTLRGPDIRRCLAKLHARGLSGRSLARVLSGWRAFYRFLAEVDPAVRENPCAGLRAPKSARRLPKALSPDEAVQLVELDGDDPLALRDRAILELFYSSGLRLSELAGADLESLDLGSGEVRVLGKGRKERVIPVGRAAQDALRRWIAARGAIAPEAERALFVGRGGRRLGVRAIQERLRVRAIRGGLPRHVHPHMLRHSFASHVLQSSGDLRAVQEMLGHASIASTQVYTHLDFQALAKVYDQAHPRASAARGSRAGAKRSHGAKTAGAAGLGAPEATAADNGSGGQVE
jgi:integrase/recombinase XerC